MPIYTVQDDIGPAGCKLRTLPLEPRQFAPGAIILVPYTRCDPLSMSSKIAAIRRLMPAPTWGSTPSFRTTVQVIPALISTSAGTSVRRMRTGMRCASLTQVKVGLTLARSSGPSRLS